LLDGLRRGRAQSGDDEALTLEQRLDPDAHHRMVLDAEDPERLDPPFGARRGRLRDRRRSRERRTGTDRAGELLGKVGDERLLQVVERVAAGGALYVEHADDPARDPKRDRERVSRARIDTRE